MADASAYELHIRGNEGTGVPQDATGNVAVTVGSAITDLWSTPGWMQTVTSSGAGTPQTSGGIIMPQMDWDISNNDSLILMFWVQALGPGDKIAGTRFRGSESGFWLVDGGANDVLSFVVDSTGETQLIVSSRRPVFDNETHHVALCIDGTTKRAFIFVDGKSDVDVDELDNLEPLSGFDTRNNNAELMGFGISGDGGGAERSYEGLWRDIHCLVFKDEGLPHHVQNVVQYAISNPYTTLSETVVNGVTPPVRSRNVLLAVIGQSNEGRFFTNPARPILAVSSAGGTSTFTIGAGHGLTGTDLLTFSKLGETSSTAVSIVSFGTDSVTVQDSDIAAGTYDEDGGYLFAQSGVGLSEIGCPNRGTLMWTYLAERYWNSQDIWMHTVDRFAIGGTSFITDWCGTTGSGDSRAVLAGGDAGFDPNGYMSDFREDIENWSSAGFDECWVIIQHGQADAANSGTYVSTGATTDAIQLGYYGSALENIRDYVETHVAPTRIYVASSNAQALGAQGTDDSSGFENVIVPAMRALSGVQLGPMLSELLADAGNHNLLDSHLNRSGQLQAGQAWEEALNVSSSSSTPSTPSGSGGGSGQLISSVFG